MRSPISDGTITVEGLTFDLRRSDRKTLGVTVDRDGFLHLTAPRGSTREEIEAAARKKLLWVHRKLAEQRILDTNSEQKQFVSGEGFCYLGRSYRLLLADEEEKPALSLIRGRFVLRRDALSNAPEHFVRWYTAHARPWLGRRVRIFSERLEVTPGTLQVRDLGYRWGSCSTKGNVYFNWRVICLPPRLVEYVVAHELVHLKEPRHDSEFWGRLGRIVPDFAQRKLWLAENSARYIPAFEA